MEISKICLNCKLSKNISDFKKDNRRLDGTGSYCMNCIREKGRDYYNRTKESRRDINRQFRKIYYHSNKESENYKSKKYRSANKELIKKYNKEYKANNKDKYQKWNKENKQKIKDYNKTYMTNRLENDPLFKMSHTIRSMIRKSIRKKFNSIESKNRTENILGCSFLEFKSYMESKFEPWMNWNNHGIYNGEFDYGWDIDHVIPLSSATTKEEILKLNHYTNLQPLCSKINRYVKKSLI